MNNITKRNGDFFGQLSKAHPTQWPYVTISTIDCVNLEGLFEFGFLGKSLKNKGFDHLLDFDLKFLVSHGKCFCISLVKIQL